MTAGEEMYAAILADPEDLTLRLVYADWLQDNGDDDRAELIRLMIRYVDEGSLVGSEIRRGHPEWSVAACNPRDPKQDIDNALRYKPHQLCSTCHGTEDLAYLPWLLPSGEQEKRIRRIGWHAGYPNSLSCKLSELGIAKDNSDFWPSLWARRVLEVWPVTRFVLTDRMIYPYKGARDIYYWSRATWQAHDSLISRIYDLLPDYGLSSDSASMRGFKGLDTALDALAVACGTLVRNSIPKREFV